MDDKTETIGEKVDRELKCRAIGYQWIDKLGPGCGKTSWRVIKECWCGKYEWLVICRRCRSKTCIGVKYEKETS